MAAGERDSERLLQRASAEIDKAPLARIDYVELRAADSLGPVEEKLVDSALLALAVWFDSPECDSPDSRIATRSRSADRQSRAGSAARLASPS